MLSLGGESALSRPAVHRLTASQRRFLIGALGGLLPSALYLLAVDLEAVWVKLTFFAVLGMLVKVVVQCLLGGCWAYLHTNEKNSRTLAELGMLAPAIIAGILTGYTANTSTASALVSVAHAQPEPTEQVRQFTLQESGSEQFWRGLTGKMPSRVWFVIVSSHPTLPEARSAAATLRARGASEQGFEPEVYEPSGGYQSYAVVIGGHLTLREAEGLRSRAIDAGLPPDTQVWRLVPS